MIIGIGIDVITVKRIRVAMANPRFAERILTKTELHRELTQEYVAGRWAVKEALKKALPSLDSWQDVEILGEPGGPIHCHFVNPILGKGLKIWVSISHEREIAIGMAVVESTEENHQ